MFSSVPTKFHDLLEIATYVYSADQVILRGADDVDSFGDGWRRDMHFVVPVRNPDTQNSRHPPLSPWYTTKKNGRRYRYYVPQRDTKEHAGASGLPRLPAAELESAVLDQLRAILRAPNLLGDMLPQAIKLDPTLDEAKIAVAMTRLDAIWDQLFPAEQARIVKLLVEKVIALPNDLEVWLRANGIERLVLELRPELANQAAEALA